MTSSIPTILGIDPGTKEMGIAVLRGRELLEYGVHTLRNSHKPYNLIGQARRIDLSLINRWRPAVVAIEEALLLPTKRAALLSVITQELRAQARAHRLHVVQLSAREVRIAVVGNAGATKIETASALVDQGFDELRPLVPKAPRRRAFWLGPKDRYWLHMFDALALAVVARDASVPRREAIDNPMTARRNDLERLRSSPADTRLPISVRRFHNLQFEVSEPPSGAI